MPKVWTLEQRGISSPSPALSRGSHASPSNRDRRPAATRTVNSRTRRSGRRRRRWVRSRLCIHCQGPEDLIPPRGAHRDTCGRMSQDNTATVEGVRTPLKPLGERTSRRRTPDEYLRVRFPGLFRRLVEAVQRLPPHSRLRRSMITRSISRAYAAANRGDFELILSGYDPATYEYHPSIDMLPPDMEPV